MTRFATLLLALLLAPGIAAAQKNVASPSPAAALSGGPVNDDLANASIITGDGEYLSSTTGATAEASEQAASCTSADSNQSVWWVFTPTEDGPVTLDTDGSAQDAPGTQPTDTVVSILTGSAFPLTEVACNDDDPDNTAPDYTSRIENFQVTAGTTYYIRVSSFDAGRANGEARLTFTGPALVANEEAPRALTLALGAPQPNPTAGVTELTLSVDQAQRADVAVYDALGRRVLDVFTGDLSGETTFSVETRSLRAGTYVVRALGETFVSTRSITVVR